VLHPAFLEDASLAVLVRVAELPGRTICHHLDIAVRMQRPHRPRRERVVVENPQRAEALVARVVVLAEGEMPPALKRPVLDLALGLVDIFCFAYGNHGFHFTISPPSAQ